jgi:hypothetical protein
MLAAAQRAASSATASEPQQFLGKAAVFFGKSLLAAKLAGKC